MNVIQINIDTRTPQLGLYNRRSEYFKSPLKTVTVHFGPCEEDGSRVWEREVYSGRHPMSKRTCDIGVDVIKRTALEKKGR
jgi:hypothetical protein